MWLYFLPNDHPIFVNSKVQRSPLWLGGIKGNHALWEAGMLFKIFVSRVGIYKCNCNFPLATVGGGILHWCANFIKFFVLCVLFSCRVFIWFLKTCRNSLQHLLLNVLRCVCFYVQKCHTLKWFWFSEYLQ